MPRHGSSSCRCGSVLVPSSAPPRVRPSPSRMFTGSLVAIVTPMRPDGSLDLDSWEALLEWHAENGTSGVVVGGTTGESPTLSDAELAELTRRACVRARGRMAVIAGAGTSSTAATVARVRWLCELPVDGLLLVTPAYNRP